VIGPGLAEYAWKVTRSSKEDEGTQVWRVLYNLFLAVHEQNLESAAELGVSPGDLKALMRLIPGQSAQMRELAHRWRCDASTVTWIVDRLESQGLAQREPQESDLRVKVVALTEKGKRLRARLLDDLYRPPPQLAQLSAAELRALRHLVTALARTDPDP
jgi:DNA-binding MarR family transcriptional regulator